MDSVAIDYDSENVLKIGQNEILDYVSEAIQEHYLNKKIKYMPVEIQDAYKIKKILKTCQLENEVVLTNKSSVKLLGNTTDVGEEGYCYSLITGKNNNVCLVPNCDTELVLGVSNFNIKSRIKNVSVYLQRWGSVLDFVDLSDCIEDGEKIYIVKKISKIGQEGYIYRLYRNVANTEEILKRKERLIRELNNKIIDYNYDEWIVVSEINKEDLYNEEKASEVLHNFVQDFLRYALIVDSIVKKY